MPSKTTSTLLHDGARLLRLLVGSRAPGATVLLTDGWDHHTRTRAATNTQTFIHVTEGFGIHGIVDTNYTSTCAEVAALGFPNDEAGAP